MRVYSLVHVVRSYTGMLQNWLLRKNRAQHLEIDTRDGGSGICELHDTNYDDDRAAARVAIFFRCIECRVVKCRVQSAECGVYREASATASLASRSSPNYVPIYLLVGTHVYSYEYLKFAFQL